MVRTIVRAGGKGNYPLTNSLTDRMRGAGGHDCRGRWRPLPPAGTPPTTDGPGALTKPLSSPAWAAVSSLLSTRFKTMIHCCSFLFNVIVLHVTFSLNS